MTEQQEAFVFAVMASAITQKIMGGGRWSVARTVAEARLFPPEDLWADVDIATQAESWVEEARKGGKPWVTQRQGE